jgi:hypothetical protein
LSTKYVAKVGDQAPWTQEEGKGGLKSGFFWDIPCTVKARDCIIQVLKGNKDILSSDDIDPFIIVQATIFFGEWQISALEAAALRSCDTISSSKPTARPICC